MRDAVIVDSIRTGLAKSFRGTFNLTRPDDMVAHLIDGLLDRNPSLPPRRWTTASWAVRTRPVSRPATSGGSRSPSPASRERPRFQREPVLLLRAQHHRDRRNPGRERVRGRDHGRGVESITSFQRANCGEISKNPKLLENKPDIYMAMGNTAEVVARRYQLSREYQDEYALSSQRRTARAQAEGRFDDEIHRWPRAG